MCNLLRQEVQEKLLRYEHDSVVPSIDFKRSDFTRCQMSNVRLPTLIQHLWLEVPALGNKAVKVQTCTEHRKAWTKT